MHTTDGRSLRIAVQHVYQGQRSFYRVIAYSDSETYRASDFESRAHLQKALRSVWLDFDESSLLIRNDARDTHIVFTRDAKLDESQLSALGLERWCQGQAPTH